MVLQEYFLLFGRLSAILLEFLVDLGHQKSWFAERLSIAGPFEVLVTVVGAEACLPHTKGFSC